MSKYFVSRYGYLYDDEGRLTDVSGQAGKSSNRVDLLHNTYNALGQRVRKDGHGVLTFAYDEAGHLLGEYTPGGVMVREYVWLGDRLVGMLSQDEADTVLQVHTDHLGTPRAVSQDNTVLWRWEGEAFGNSAPNEQVAGSARKFTLPLRFPGQYYDSETGLNYNYFRDYNSATGRYIESDPIGLRGGINPYAYVNGNPLSGVDPLGLMCFDFNKFADQVSENRANNALTLGSLLAAEGVGTMPKTPGEMRALGLPKSEINPITNQLSRWSGRFGTRALRELGRTTAGIAAGAIATGAVVFEGFYDWGVIGKAAVDATSSSD